MALPFALIVDRVLGDPGWLWRWLPHPVVLMGRAVGVLDKALNDAHESSVRRRLYGVVGLAILVIAGVVAGVLMALALSRLPSPMSVFLEAILASVLLAQKSLVDHVLAVRHGLMQGLTEGRAAVTRIVGRDVNVLDEAGVARGAIESAAENFSDAVVAPIFWYALLGLPGLIVFKIVNTADSMIGHRSPRYEAFGWAAARFDDLLNLVPARLSALLIAAAALLTARSPRRALTFAWRDAYLHKSPNAGWPEAATAGALGLALGGPRRYEDRKVEGAWLNAEGRKDARTDDIRDAVRLIDVAWAILLALSALIALWLVR